MQRMVASWCCAFGLVIGASAQVRPSATPPPAHHSERGLASWYGVPYDGQRSASGEIYHQEELTAAHPTLPFGTRVRVRRVGTNRSVVVRINDRGPFVGSRIIDLSRAAASRLGMLQRGVALVAVEVVSTPGAKRGRAADDAGAGE